MAKNMKIRRGNDGFSYPYTSPDLVIDENGKSATTKFNELEAKIGTGSGTSIDDVNTSTNKTWSSSKIDSQFKDIANKKTDEKSGLSGWKSNFSCNRKRTICMIGDSTTDGPAGPAQFIYSCFNTYHTVSGGLLDGVTIVDKGSSGNTCYNFINNTPKEKGIDACISLQADLYVFCYGINDVRLGTTTKEQLQSYIITAVERILKETSAYIVLRTPNSLLLDDIGNTGWVTPLEKAQEYSNILWEAYKELENKWARVQLIDMQELVFGRVCGNKADRPLMNDILHPSAEGMYKIANVLAEKIGEYPKIDYKYIYTFEGTNNELYKTYPKFLETSNFELICEGNFIEMGSTYLDFDNDANMVRTLIKKNDIVKIGDILAYDLMDPTIYSVGKNTRISGVTFNGYEKNNKGQVKIYRKKGTFEKTFSFYGTNINQTILGTLPIGAVTISKIEAQLGNIVPANIEFRLKEIINNDTKEIAIITFQVNNMTGTFSWNSTNAPNSIYTFSPYGVVYLECTNTTYTENVLLKLTLTNS